MAALDLQEQEQVDALRHWWQDNGKWVVGAVVVAALAFAGFRFWQGYQAKQAEEAGALFAELGKQLATNDAKRVNDAASAVIDKYASSAYAPRAALVAAEVDLQTKDIEGARARLQWVLDHAKEEGLQSVARLKLAAILLDEKNYSAALQLVGSKHPESFDALYADMKGDILMAQGQADEARKSYKVAFDKSEQRSSYRNLIQMKLDALGGAQ
jgi:predicted negative regulator of RcsB-dependent stress response